MVIVEREPVVGVEVGLRVLPPQKEPAPDGVIMELVSLRQTVYKT